MTDISTSVHSIIVAIMFSIIALRPQGRSLMAARILCGIVLIYFIANIFSDMPIRVTVDPVLASWLGKGANLLAMAAALWMLVSSVRRASRDADA